jgi:hypothetical protein
MKKYFWLFIGIAVLVLGTAAVLSVPANSMSADCAEDGSCCEDVNNCTCG